MKIKIWVIPLVVIVAISIQAAEECQEPKQVCQSVPKDLCHHSIANLCPCTCKDIVPFPDERLKSKINMDHYEEHAHHDRIINPHPVSAKGKWFFLFSYQWYWYIDLIFQILPHNCLEFGHPNQTRMMSSIQLQNQFGVLISLILLELGYLKPQQLTLHMIWPKDLQSAWTNITTFQPWFQLLPSRLPRIPIKVVLFVSNIHYLISIFFCRCRNTKLHPYCFD